MSLVTAFEPEADLGDQRGSGTASQLLQVVLVLVAVGLGVVVTRWTHGAVRLDLITLVVALIVVPRWPVRIAAVVVALMTRYVLSGGFLTDDRHTALSFVAVLQAVAVAAVLAWVLRPAQRQVSLARRFSAFCLLGVVTVVVGAQVEMLVEGYPHGFSERWSSFVEVTLPLAVGFMVAAALVSAWPEPGGSRPLRTLLRGPITALALTAIAMQAVGFYWHNDEQKALDTASSTVAASFQQVLGDDLTALAARTSTPPASALAGRDQVAFDRYSSPLVQGNGSVVASALVVPDGAELAVPFVLGKSAADSSSLRSVMLDPASTEVVNAALMTGVPLLLGLRDVPAADGSTAPIAVYVAPIKAADGGQPTELLAMSVSVPVAFAQSALAIGALRGEVRSTLALTSGPGIDQPRVVAVDSPGVAPADVRADVTGTSPAGVGDYTFEVVISPGTSFGLPVLQRILVMVVLLLLGLSVAVVLLQAVASRERARRDAAERSALLAVALEAAPDRMLIVDSRGTVLMSNHGTHADVAGKPVIDTLPFVLHGEEGDRVRRLVERARDGDAGVAEYTDVMSEEGPQTFLVQVSPVAAEVAGDARAVVQIKDLTEERARAVRSAQTERLRSLGTMAGGLAHDFNNLLFIISGYLQMLADDEEVSDSDHLRRYVERASDAAERGAEIASSLLSVARSQPLEATAIEVGAFVKRLSPLIKQAVGSERSVRFDIGSGPLDVLVDSGQLSGSLLNLVINSRDAMEPGGTVVVRVRRDHVRDTDLDLVAQDYVVIEVVDDGIGMPPEVQQRAFEPYFTTKGVGDGTGIGLAAVYSFAQQSGGLAVIESEHGLGTTVRVYLPAVFAEHAAPLDPPIGEDGASSASRVLVVDDEAALAGLIAGWLTEQGAEVRVADNPAQAMRVAEEFVPDVLLTDVRLGDPTGVDGPDLAARILESMPELNVVFMTGFSDRMDELLDRGFHTLAKPFTKDALVRVLYPVQTGTADSRRAGA